MVSSSGRRVVNIDELRTRHAIGRQLYTRLVFQLRRDPILCIQVMSFWMYMERLGFPNVIKKLVDEVDDIVNGVFDEATAAIGGLAPNSLLPGLLCGMPNTAALTEGQQMSVMTINLKRSHMVSGITLKVKNVGVKAFGDIAEQAIEDGLSVPNAGPLPIIPVPPVPFPQPAVLGVANPPPQVASVEHPTETHGAGSGVTGESSD